MPYVHPGAPILGALLVVVVGKWLASRLRAPAHEVPLAAPGADQADTHKERE